MKILHAADIHFSREHQTEALASLACLAETAEREQPALVAIAGDLFDRGVTNSAASGFPALLAVIQRILDVCPIAAVSGTPTHDLPGCYEALTKLQGRNGFRFNMILPHNTVFHNNDQGEHDLLVLGLPEPSREWLLAGKEGASAEETAEAMKDALRGILLGLGALGAEHPEIPCVFLYHGAVAGATMQNGQLVAAGDIALGREDLALVGADAYLLGHIHLAQQIAGLPAYYAGSAHPVSWGELGQSGFNMVEIAQGVPFDSNPAFEAVVTRIPFPHPRRVKFSLAWPEPVGEELQGLQAWVCYRATKEEAQKIDTAAILEAYLEAGALPGSRVTVEMIPTETVRAGQITGAPCLAVKVQVYARASSQEVSASVLAKADALEREATERGAVEGMHVRIRRLRLRGAVGIWKGQRVDDFDIDLDRYSPGLLALVGANGAGKSTLIENMHPYPCMLTRDGKLQDHFRLRDSARELWFVDERTSAEYRALMEIDGANATGQAKLHLFRDNEPLTNGRREDYEEKIGALFGSLPLFLRSAFVSQRATKSNPDLSEATKGEKKAIFRELAGLDYLQAHAESAKAKGNAIEGEITTERARISLIESQLVALPRLQEDRAKKDSDLARGRGSLGALEENGKSLAAGVATLLKQVQEQRSLTERIAGLQDQLAQKQQIVLLTEEAIQRGQAALEQRPLAEKVIATWDTLKEQENAENKRLATVNADNARLQGEYSNRLKAHHADVRKVEGEQSALKTENARLAGDRKVLQAQIDHLAGELKVPLKENCPTCGQVLPLEKRAELNRKRAESEEKLCNLQQKHSATGQQIAGIDQQLAAITLPPDLPPLVLPPVDQAPLRRIQGAIAVLDVVQARKTLATAQEAATRIEEATKRRTEAGGEATRLTAEITAAQGKVDPEIQPAYEAAQGKLETAREEYGEAQEAIAALKAEIKGMDARIAELSASEKDLGERKIALEEQQAEAAEWRYLELACGADGIQALELDAMGPGISEVANRLLSAAYGSRFSIELRTTRIAGKGSRTKQVEDFAIIVLDNELLTEQPIETLSGGEGVWIKQALYSAFAIIRDKTTGLRFLTAFKDECDGALDPESRAKYFQLLEAEHNESGRRHTLIITHSESAQEMIPQRIVMARAS